MGLLDDAIREHLDLKRARGGDPAEIERMEREALGPVRREPTIGSVRFDTVEEVAPHAFQESEFDEEHLTELEELQELGYNDSTAPHAHPHHEHGHPSHEHVEPDLDFERDHAEYPEPTPEEIEQPKRRFLRRNRAAPLAEPAASPDPGFYEEQPTEYHDLLEHPNAPAHNEAGLPPETSPPPHLQFEQPPKRPRFTPEPPPSEPETGEHPDAPPEPQDVAPTPAPAPAVPEPTAPEPTAREPTAPEPTAPEHPAAEYEHFDEHQAQQPEPQETTEFDVPKHLAEAPPEGQDEDVLEETPEFLQDTPEHDRLWFEQRPPKDFDFNG